MEKEKDFTIEEKHKRVKEFRPIDDAFFEVLANDIDFCQEMLRILLDDEKLIVEDVIVQSSERNIYGRSVRLDALCFLKRYGKCNVEVQRSGSDDHLRRVRFNASSIAVKDSQTKQRFKDIEDIASIFHEELFYQAKSSTKEDVLKGLCDRATDYFEIEGLHSQVQQREEIGSTYFSKDIAVPHPMYAVSSDTFVSVCVSKQPITWDEENNQVNLIMLMHIGKNNTQAFQLWDYISKIFADKTLVEKLVEDPSYDKFIALMKEALESGLNQ